MINFPKHDAALYLTHNDHKSVYETVKKMIESDHPAVDKDYFVSDEDMQKCIDTNELWELQWYPHTPVGFIKVCGSTLEIVLNEAKRIEEA